MKLLKHIVLIIYKAKAAVLSDNRMLTPNDRKWDFLIRTRIVLKLNSYVI